MADLEIRTSTSQLALAFTILTAARTGESLKARWEEIDFEKKLWTVPADRMKGGREHKVPLSAPAIDILLNQKKVVKGEFVFPSDRGKPLSDMTLTTLLRGMGYQDKDGRQIVTHGFRSTFRDWAYERSSFPREIVEAALAHVNGDKTEAAYKRGEAIAKRSRLMQAWADYCAQRVAGEVVSIKRSVA